MQGNQAGSYVSLFDMFAQQTGRQLENTIVWLGGIEDRIPGKAAGRITAEKRLLEKTKERFFCSFQRKCRRMGYAEACPVININKV